MATVMVDLDGTLASYDGWKGEWQIGDPIDGAIAAMAVLIAQGHNVYVHTVREEKEHVEGWLRKHEFPSKMKVWSGAKPIAMVYIDDRAVRFRSWTQAMQEVKEFLPE